MTLTYSCSEPTGIIIVFEDGEIVADLSVSGRVEGSGSLDFDAQVERARMICAAPEMAEALLAAKHALAELSIYVPYNSQAYELGGGVYSQIDDALTKARGEESS